MKKDALNFTCERLPETAVGADGCVRYSTQECRLFVQSEYGWYRAAFTLRPVDGAGFFYAINFILIEERRNGDQRNS